MEPVKSGWQDLKTTSGPKCPKLFYNFTANQDGYTLQFTDLIGFWIAESPAVDVVDYAKITKTSIDPSDSKSQLQVLLQKLCQSLSEGENTLRLEESETETEAILLQTILKLPRPLQPLKWEFYLEPRGTEELAENILRPCLLEASESKKKIDSLHEVIKVKDHVISKLLDKIEGTAIDLSMIFPGITGARSRKGQTTLKDAQKHVPGLKPFNTQEWQRRFHLDSNPYTGGFETAGLSKLVSGCEKCPKHKSHQHEQWLKKLPRATSSASQAAKLGMEASSDEDDTESDSDQFETQRKKANTKDGLKNPSGRAKTSSPLRSSSPLLPPPSLSISQNQDPIRSSSTTMTSDASDNELDTTTTAKTARSRLGRLGKSRTKTPNKSRPQQPCETQSSSPPPIPRLPSPSPAIPSSPPPLPPLPTTGTATTLTAQPTSSSSIATLSSLNPPNTPPDRKRKLSRLNSFRTNSVSASASAPNTPDHKRVRLETQDSKPEAPGNKQPQSQTQTQGQGQGTPTRRLGRIGRTASQLSRQQTHSSPLPIPIPLPIPEGAEADQEPSRNKEYEEDIAMDSDASTASTASSVSPLPKPVTANPDANDQSSTNGPVNATIDPAPREREPTKAEKAAARREELKQKIRTGTGRGGSGGAATVGNTGLRKKRKF